VLAALERHRARTATLIALLDCLPGAGCDDATLRHFSGLLRERDRSLGPLVAQLATPLDATGGSSDNRPVAA